MTSIPTSYEDSRQRFKQNIADIRRCWSSARLEHHALDGQEDLSIDWILADARKRKERLLVISTGLHGIEGFIGAAVLQLFLNEFLRHLNPDTNGILFIHSLNPWGMKHWKRINPHNVDLNRNFIYGEYQSPDLENPDFLPLTSFLCPDRMIHNLAIEKMRFIVELVKTIIMVGTTRLREAALMGQYDYPTGIYFGGQFLQEETQTVMALYQNAFMGYDRIIHIDLHSGYGPRSQMTVVTSPQEPLSSREIQIKYKLDRVAGANPDEFYSMHGDMNDWEYELVRKKYPESQILAVNFEFGTFGNSFLAEARSLRITIYKNQLNQKGASKSAEKWVDQEYRNLYLPLDPTWYDKVWQDARQGFTKILIAEGMIKQ